jgi:predicted transcriptional regulator
MVDNDSSLELDLVFEALANKHRREIVRMLGLQPCSISYLAAKRKLSLPAIHKHIDKLVKADMVFVKKTGRTNFLAIKRKSLLRLQAWLNQYQAYWGNDEETLENYSEYLKGGEK